MRKPRTAIWIAILTVGVCAGYLGTGAVVRSKATQTCREAARVLQVGNPQRARDSLRWLLWFDPDHPEARHIVGLSYLQEKLYPAAILNLAAVPQDSASHRAAQLELVAASLADYRIEQAEAALRRVLSEFPDESRATTQLYGLLLAEWRVDEACDLLLHEISDNGFPSRAVEEQLSSLRMLAKAEFDADPPASCIPLLLQSFDRHPNQGSVALALGVCYWKSDDMHNARQYLEIADKLNPDEPDVIFARAEFLLEVNETDAAARQMDRLSAAHMSIQDTDDFCRVQSRLEEQLDNPEQGLKFALRALEIQPNNREYNSRVARLLQKTGQIEEVAKYYERSHAIAQNELALWKLTRSLPDIPAPAECERTSDLYRKLGRVVQAEAWSGIAAVLKSRASDNRDVKGPR